MRLVSASAKRGGNLQLTVTDAGAGVDPQSLTAKIDGKPADVAYSRGRGIVSLRTAGPGRHTLVFTAADYQELKNMENVPQILPNTRTFKAVFPRRLGGFGGMLLVVRVRRASAMQGRRERS